MRILLLPLSARLIVYTAVVLITAILLAALVFWSASIFLAIPLIAFGALAVLGTYDLIQQRHAVLRNYPLTAHIRFILEEIRPEIRQYFLESEKDGTPFSRDKRAIVSARQARLGQTAVRHAERRLRLRLRVAAPFDRAETPGKGAIPRRRRRV
jgi:hypothetical protein